MYMDVLPAYVCVQYLKRPEGASDPLGLELHEPISYQVVFENGTYGLCNNT